MAVRKNSYYVDLINTLDETAIIDGAEEFVEKVKQAGLKTAVGSSSKIQSLY